MKPNNLINRLHPYIVLSLLFACALFVAVSAFGAQTLYVNSATDGTLVTSTPSPVKVPSGKTVEVSSGATLLLLGNVSANGTTVSPVEVGYLDTVTSNIQTQFGTLTSAVAAKAGIASPTFTGIVKVDSASPLFVLYETDGTANQRRWDIAAQGGDFSISATTDSGVVDSTILSFDRSDGSMSLPRPTTIYSADVSNSFTVNGEFTALSDITLSGFVLSNITMDGGAITHPPSGSVRIVDSNDTWRVAVDDNGVYIGNGSATSVSVNANGIEIYTPEYLYTQSQSFTYEATASDSQVRGDGDGLFLGGYPVVNIDSGGGDVNVLASGEIKLTSGTGPDTSSFLTLGIDADLHTETGGISIHTSDGALNLKADGGTVNIEALSGDVNIQATDSILMTGLGETSPNLAIFENVMTLGGAAGSGQTINAVNSSGIGFLDLANEQYLRIHAGDAEFLIEGGGGSVTLPMNGASDTVQYTERPARFERLGGSSPAATIAAGAGAGTSPTVSITGSNLAGQITVLTGTLPTVNTVIATVTFNGSAFGAGPYVVLWPANAAASSLGFLPYATSTTTAFTISNAVAMGLVGATTYKYNYIVVQ